MNLKEKLLGKIDFPELLEHFSNRELALLFKISINNVNRLEHIQNESKKKLKKYDDEMSIGVGGAWKELKQTNMYKSLMNKYI